jgi:hypothetical protein
MISWQTIKMIKKKNKSSSSFMVTKKHNWSSKVLNKGLIMLRKY